MSIRDHRPQNSIKNVHYSKTDDIFRNNDSQCGKNRQKKKRKRKSTGKESSLKTGSEKPIMG
jgi:hypothetical protein